MQVCKLGIIGGTGPLATIDIENKVFWATHTLKTALVDQDFFDVVNFNFAQIRDRSDFKDSKCSSPVKQYEQLLDTVDALGCHVIILACNTAHQYLPYLQRRTKSHIISMIGETYNFCRENFPAMSQIGLLSTKATYDSKIYHDHFAKDGIHIMNVSPLLQTQIMQAIYLIKSGVELNTTQKEIHNPNDLSRMSKSKFRELKEHPYKKVLVQDYQPNPSYVLREAVEELKNSGCQGIIFGCTELPLVLQYLKETPGVTYIDPNQIIAEAAIKKLIQMEQQPFVQDNIPQANGDILKCVE